MSKGPIIAHADMDAFFVEAELLDKPHLRGTKVIVAGQGRSVVLSASYEARADGVRSAMPLSRATQISPDSTVIPPQRQRYRELSTAIMSYFDTVTDRKEQVSVDEAFLDLSGAVRRLGPVRQIGASIRHDIREKFGLPVSVGIADRKFISKIASSRAKPDGLLTVSPHQRIPFLHALEVTALWGVGAKTAQSLHEMGLRTVGQLAATPREALRRRFGVSGEHLHDLSWGHDPRGVEPVREEKSIGAEETFTSDISSTEELSTEVLRLSHKVATRLRAAGLRASGISLKLRWKDFSTLTRSASLDHPTQAAAQLHQTCMSLLDALGARPQPVRLIGVRAERLGTYDGGLQLSFTEAGDDAREDHRLAAERALDAIAGRFPSTAAGPASLFKPRRDADGQEDTPEL